MKKWFKRILLGLLLGLLLLIGGGWFLLGTQPGVNWLLQMVKSYVPGEFDIQRVEGTLLGQLRLYQLTYENPDMLLGMGELELSWQPRELWQRKLHIDRLGSDRVQFEWRKAADDSPSEPAELTDIKLPIEISLDQFSVKNAEILPAPDAAPIVVNALDLSAIWTADGMNLSQLELSTPEVSLQGKGALNPVNEYPLELTTSISLVMEGVPKVTAMGTIAGDLQQLELRQEITGDVTASVSAELEALLEELRWSLNLHLTQLPSDFLPPDIPGDLVLDVTGNGDLVQGSADVRAQLPFAGTSEKPATDSLINLTASCNFSDLSFNVKGGWENVQWPLSGPAQYASQKAGFKVTGSADDYQFTLDADVTGADIPPGKLLANGQGNTEHIVLESLQGDILQGKVALNGKLNWKPIITWNVQLDATGINPAVMAADWPGKLDLSATSKGEFKDEKLSLSAELKQLAGTLREKTLSGSGKFKMAAGEINLQQLSLNSGQATLFADGKLASQWNLDWQFEVPDMGDILPEASGQIGGKGRLQGDAKQPVIEGQVSLRELGLQGVSLQTARGDFSLGLNPEHQSRLSLDAGSLQLDGQLIESLVLQLDGALANHNLNLSVVHEMAELQMVSSGGYSDDTAAWKGELQNLTVNGEEVGSWQLKAPAALDLSATKALVESICLHELNAAEICVDANWSNAESGKANARLKQFSLERLAPLLPPQIAKLDGMIDTEVNVDLGEVISANLNAVIEQGVFSYFDPKGHEISMQHRGGEVQGVLDKEELKANWKLELDQHLLAGDLHIPRSKLDADPTGAPMTGNIQVDLKDLNLVTAFVPAIEKIDGSADVDLQITGTVAEPRIVGHARVLAGVIDIPQAGLELRNADIGIEGDGGNKLDIKGKMSSGNGQLDLNGNLMLDGSQGWPLQLTLKGEQFQAVNLPQAQVIISPDIQLSTVKDVLKLRGKLLIPKAVVELKELPEGSVSASSDVVIIENGEIVGGDTGFKVDAEVTLELGDEIKFSGLGAKARLNGRLTVYNVPGKLPTAHGELKILRGSYRAYGQDLSIESGRVSYAGGNLDNPSIRLRASRRIDDITVGIDVTGTAKKLELIGFSSDPEMTSDDAIAMLVTGQRTSDPGAARVYAGKELSEDLSVGVNVGGGDEGTEFVVRYRLMDRVNLEGTSSSKKSGGRIMYGFEVK